MTINPNFTKADFHSQGLDNTNAYNTFNESGLSVPFDDFLLQRIITLLEYYEKCQFKEIEVVFVDEKKIIETNRQYLNHDYITDIITFPYGDETDLLEGTLFCCAAQIKRQAKEFEVSFENEVLRIVIHGLLHLIGYDDATDERRSVMRTLEDKYIRYILENE